MIHLEIFLTGLTSLGAIYILLCVTSRLTGVDDFGTLMVLLFFVTPVIILVIYLIGLPVYGLLF